MPRRENHSEIYIPDIEFLSAFKSDIGRKRLNIRMKLIRKIKAPVRQRGRVILSDPYFDAGTAP